MSAPDKKRNLEKISVNSDLLLENPKFHDTPIMQSDLSDSTMQTKLLWQEDKNSFSLWLSRQIISD